jgi:Bacterial Ig-like domain (group 3)
MKGNRAEEGPFQTPSRRTVLPSLSDSVRRSDKKRKERTAGGRQLVQSPGAATPSGTVHFLVDGVEFASGTPDNNDQVVVQTDSLDVGSHTITVHYDGDSNTTASDSSSISVTIDG